MHYREVGDQRKYVPRALGQGKDERISALGMRSISLWLRI
jgi:hypothetical protein